MYHFNCLREECIFISVDNTDCCYLVATNGNDAVIGFISWHIQHLLHRCRRVAEIEEFFVDKTFREMGIGSGLVNSLVKKIN